MIAIVEARKKCSKRGCDLDELLTGEIYIPSQFITQTDLHMAEIAYAPAFSRHHHGGRIRVRLLDKDAHALA